MICVVIGRNRHKMVIAETQEAAKQGAKMIELRLDFLAKAPDFKRLLADKPCELVACVRRQEDGGRWGGSEDQRRMLLRQATVAGFDWIDVETDVADDIRRFKNVKRIVSYHNLRDMPNDLEDIHARMCKQDADVVKLAVAAKKPSDNLRVLDLIRQAPKPTVALCMGNLGLPSRILSGKFGAPFTYAAFNKERGVAPGMPSFDEMKNVYHYDQINAETKIFGLIGDPVSQSLGPVIHNRAFRKLGINAVYVPFRVPEGNLPAFLKEFDRLPMQGYSVTMPHKETAATLARVKDPSVNATGAANTLLRIQGGFSAANTDVLAARESLLAHMPVGGDGKPAKLSEQTVLLLGAGGAGRAVAHVLQREGAKIIIANRTPERAEKLAKEVNGEYVVWDERHDVECDLLINCTSIGMYPNVNESPLHASFFKQGLMVFDTVYTPENTLLVKEARERDCHVLTGVDMFARQAAIQFGLFISREPPLKEIREEVKRALSPLSWRGEA